MPCWKFPRCSDSSCPFQHRPRTESEERERTKAKKGRPRSASPAAPASGICYEWKNTGTCKHGDNCKFRHDNPHAHVQGQKPPGAPAKEHKHRRKHSKKDKKH